MSDSDIILTSDLENTFRAYKNRNPEYLANQKIESNRSYKPIPKNNYAPISSTSSGLFKTAGVDTSTIYGQPMFFSPIHTPINWQIPSKRLEETQWARFFYRNEPKVASAIDFYSDFPMNDYEHEGGNAEVRKYFDKLKDRLELEKWTRLMSHEIHLLGNCFPYLEISCPICHGVGRIGSEVCEHEGGTVKRLIILNPDYVDVHTPATSTDPIISLRPDEELINMVQRKLPGYEKLSQEVLNLVASGQPIRLDNKNVDHLKYGECGYEKYGIGMVRRLFPILSYKTKLMVAQWTVAERLIVPVKVVKVGSDERPAGPADIAGVLSQISATSNDPNLTLVTHHAFDIQFVGASGSVLTLSNEFDFINQEILDGMMINNALLNGEGPTFSSASVGIEAMMQRLKTFRTQIKKWIEKKIYLPEAIRQGFCEKDEKTGEIEYIYPRIKWNSMNLRDQENYRSSLIQLYDKGLVSAQTLLEAFELDPDQEIERKRYDTLQIMAVGGQPGGGDAGGGGFGGMGDMGGGDMGGMGDMGGDSGLGGLGEDIGDAGEPPISAPNQAMAKSKSITAEIANPQEFGGKILKKKTRDKIKSEKEKMYSRQEREGVRKDRQGQTRDQKGRVVFTKTERGLIDNLLQAQKTGIIKENIIPQFAVRVGSQEYSLDFAIPSLKIGLEADGEVFHSSPKQVSRDNQRDMKLKQQGWTILRFTDEEIEKKGQQIVSTVSKEIMKKRLWMQKNIEK